VRVTLRHLTDAFHGFFGLPGVLSRADEAIAEVAAANGDAIIDPDIERSRP
jgi:hypothetical protein